ncbi:GGDEF domain-containing response regulator [Desulfonatronovibrio hydrogenovorans]|uniref:GGDEF domain-containing response regulator n=1 Tax=Desulfonatronovibrio hydrogenovorans TaxID=53245 RepID=UPI00048B7CA2|nr:diguanylate cyclase [Desulfonatronovibrio hydrogenovorans]
MKTRTNREITKPLRECLNLVFPPVMPMLVREAAKPAPDLEELARIVALDPGLTVTILSLANSSYYGLTQKVSDLKRAMVVLGSKEILKLAISVTLKKSLSLKLGRCRHVEFQNWAVMLWGALASDMLARKAAPTEADNVYICALVKDLSLLLLCCSEDPKLKKHASLCLEGEQGILCLRENQLEEEHKAWGITHARLTMDLLEYWGFPEGGCMMLADHHDLENIQDHEPAVQTLILGTYWAEVEMGGQDMSRLFQVRGMVKGLFGLDENEFEQMRSRISSGFRAMCQNLSLTPEKEDVVFCDFPVHRIQDLYFTVQEVQDVQGGLQDVVRTLVKHLYWLWGIDAFEVCLLSPITHESILFSWTRDQGIMSQKESMAQEHTGAGIQFFLGTYGYLRIKKVVDEETLSELDLYAGFLTRNFETYFYRTLKTTSKARLMDFMPVGVARLSSRARVLQVNRRFREIFSLNQDPTGRDFWELARGIVQQDEDDSWKHFVSGRTQRFSKIFCPLEPSAINPDSPCWHMTAHRVTMEGDLQILIILEDVAEISTLEQDIVRQGEYLRGIINSMQDLVFTIDEQGTILFTSPGCSRQLVGKNFFRLSNPSSVLAGTWGPGILTEKTGPVEVSFFTEDSVKSLELIISRLSGHSRPQYLVVGRDLTMIRRLEEKIKKQATFDHLTAVFNRHQFSIFLDREILRSRRKGSGLGIIFFDLDRFKEFNDRYGHQEGDAALKNFGKTLINNSRKGMDYPCRFGGDEFVLLVTDADRTGLEDLVNRLVESYSTGHDFDLTLSIGMAILNEGETKEQFLDRADKALFKAKAISGNAFVWAENS